MTKGKATQQAHPDKNILLDQLGQVLNSNYVNNRLTLQHELMGIARELWNNSEPNLDQACSRIESLILTETIGGGLGMPEELKSLYKAVHSYPSMRQNMRRGVATSTLFFPIWFGGN